MSLTLRDLIARLGENAAAGDVEIIVDDGSGDGYTLDAVFDYGDYVVLVGDNARRGNYVGPPS